MEGKPAGRKSEDLLQEEFLQERAYVLGRAGEKLAQALARLTEAGEQLDALCAQHRGLPAGPEAPRLRRQCLRELNDQIRCYNALRQDAKLMFYYLIVTREAMGMRRHHFVEEAYRIPPRRNPVREGA
jgi:hypothetical protein